MSNNLCIDPQVYYNQDRQSCELPHEDKTSSKSLPKSSTAKPGSIPPSYYASLPNSALPSRSLAYYQNALLNSQDAFAGYSQSSGVIWQRDPVRLGIQMVLAANPASCSVSREPIPGQNGSGEDASTGSTTNPDPGPNSSGSGGTSGTGGSGGTGGVDSNTDSGTDTGSAPGVPGEPQLLDEVPCGPGAFISDLDADIGVCAKTSLGEGGASDFQFFEWSPSGGIQSGEGSPLPLGFQPEQVFKTQSGSVYITTHANVDENVLAGMVRIDGGTTTPFTFSNDATGPKTTSSNREVSVVVSNMPKGLVEFNDKIFVALSNYDEVHGDYQPGRVTVYDPDKANWSFIHTQGFNPTSMALIQNKLYVVTSGAMNVEGTPLTESFLEVYNPLNYQRIGEPLSLGNTLAGIGGEMAVTSDEKYLVIPTGNNSGTLIKVDLTNLSGDPELLTVPATTGKILLNSVSFDESNQYIYVGNLNDGTVYTLEFATGDFIGSTEVDETAKDMESDPDSFLGLSECLRQGLALICGVGHEIREMSL